MNPPENNTNEIDSLTTIINRKHHFLYKKFILFVKNKKENKKKYIKSIVFYYENLKKIGFSYISLYYIRMIESMNKSVGFNEKQYKKRVFYIRKLIKNKEESLKNKIFLFKSFKKKYNSSFSYSKLLILMKNNRKRREINRNKEKTIVLNRKIQYFHEFFKILSMEIIKKSKIRLIILNNYRNIFIDLISRLSYRISYKIQRQKRISHIINQLLMIRDYKLKRKSFFLIQKNTLLKGRIHLKKYFFNTFIRIINRLRVIKDTQIKKYSIRKTRKTRKTYFNLLKRVLLYKKILNHMKFIKKMRIFHEFKLNKLKNKEKKSSFIIKLVYFINKTKQIQSKQLIFFAFKRIEFISKKHSFLKKRLQRHKNTIHNMFFILKLNFYIKKFISYREYISKTVGFKKIIYNNREYMKLRKGNEVKEMIIKLRKKLKFYIDFISEMLIRIKKTRKSNLKAKKLRENSLKNKGFSYISLFFRLKYKTYQYYNKKIKYNHRKRVFNLLKFACNLVKNQGKRRNFIVKEVKYRLFLKEKKLKLRILVGWKKIISKFLNVKVFVLRLKAKYFYIMKYYKYRKMLSNA